MLFRSVAQIYRDECKKYEIELIELPSRHQNPIEHYRELKRSISCKHYDIIHVHGNSSLMAIELFIAKQAGIKVRIAHSHNSVCPNMTLHNILNLYFRKLYTHALACGTLAGDWLFGKGNFQVIPNGFNTEKFYFDPLARDLIRKKLGLENKIVIGHVGRFNFQKNHQYLIKIFEKIAASKTDVYLLLIGIGPDYEKIEEIISKSLYKNRIILYGETREVGAIYSAMDVFVLPSRYEGLPVVLLEAQISGLPCVVSDKVTREVDFGDIRWESIDDVPEVWGKAILDQVSKPINRLNYYSSHKEWIRKYDIENTVKQLERIYLSAQK